MEKIGFWESLTISFQPRAYKKIVSQPFGRSFRYLAIFLLLVSLVLSIKYTLVLRGGMEKADEWINAQAAGMIAKNLPEEIKIKDGQVSTTAKEPFVRYWDFGGEGKKGEVAFIIDTTGRTRDLKDYRQGLLLTKNKLIFKNTKPGGAVEIREQDLSKIKLFVLRRGDKDKGELAVFTSDQKTFPLTYKVIKRWRKKASRLLPLMIVPLLIYYLIAKTIHLFFFSLASLIINDLTKAGLEYKKLLNIGAFALVPPTVLALLLMVAGEFISYLGILYILVYLICLAMGIVKSKAQSDKDTVSSLSS